MSGISVKTLRFSQESRLAVLYRKAALKGDGLMPYPITREFR